MPEGRTAKTVLGHSHLLHVHGRGPGRTPRAPGDQSGPVAVAAALAAEHVSVGLGPAPLGYREMAPLLLAVSGSSTRRLVPAPRGLQR
jgi:hypothetical protein